MSPTVGPRDNLISLRTRAEDPDRFIGRSIGELADQRAYLLGRLIEVETEKLADQYRGGNMTDRERAVCADELRSAWSRLAAGVGDRTEYDRLIDLGRGTTGDPE